MSLCMIEPSRDVNHCESSTARDHCGTNTNGDHFGVNIDWIHCGVHVTPHSFAQELWSEFNRTAITVVSCVKDDSSDASQLAMTVCMVHKSGSQHIARNLSAVVCYALNVCTRRNDFQLNATNEITAGGCVCGRVSFSSAAPPPCDYHLLDIHVNVNPQKSPRAADTLSPSKHLFSYSYLAAFGREHASESWTSLFELTTLRLSVFYLQNAIISAFHAHLPDDSTKNHEQARRGVTRDLEGELHKDGFEPRPQSPPRSSEEHHANGDECGRTLPPAYQIKFIHLPTIDSTQTYCEAHLKEFNLDSTLTVVSTDFQTAGLGTSNRPWKADAGRNVLMSLVFRFPARCDRQFLADNLSCVTKVVSIAIIDTLDLVIFAALADHNSADAHKLSMKWPNDILLNEKKIGGILAKCIGETVNGQYLLNTVIVGFGININSKPETLNALDRPIWPASSISQEIGRELDISPLRVLLAESFCQQLQVFFQTGFAAFKDRCSEREIFMGRQVKFRTDDRIIEGIFRGIGERGEILLETHTGMERLFSGEIIP
eukprot:GEMP01037164.1.p1 GENE.GEMP01037164.1~~GEMP01037164.1.p1  ORF type:complete len:544 (+),score=89.54 GEMP01037164.1:92-1723(+)